jgi:hypothetical protein
MSQSEKFQECKKLILKEGAPSAEFYSECAKLHSLYNIFVKKMHVPPKVVHDCVLSKSGSLGIIFPKCASTFLHGTKIKSAQWEFDIYNVNTCGPISKKYQRKGTIFFSLDTFSKTP